MSNNEQQMTQFYAIYYARYDGGAAKDDLFYELRRDFFSNGQRLKNKVVRRSDGMDYRYSYLLENGNPMKWKKLAGYRLLEKSFAESDGSYQIVTQDAQKHIRKAAFFDFDHRWKRTEYFSPDVRKIPTSILMPVRGGEAIVVKEYAPRAGEENGYELYPCGIPEDSEELTLLNGAAGIPEVVARTNKGDFYFCRAEEVERRKTVLQAIRNGNQAKPLFSPERKPEETAGEADREDGFHVEDPTEPDQESMLPISNELLLTENKGKQVEQLKSEVEAALSRYENIDSYQWGASSPELKKYEELEKQEDPEPVLEERKEDLSQEEEPPQKLEEEVPKLESTPPVAQEVPCCEEPPVPKEEPAYTYDRKIPDESLMPRHLETTEEKQEEIHTYRRYNVMVKPMAKDTYLGSIPPMRQSSPKQEEEDEALIYDDAEGTCRHTAGCNGVENGCPYAIQGKMRIDVAPGESYYYYGNVIDGKRQGRGRTIMQNGCTAYEGTYETDKREGFGVYYYKTGRLCYAGNWKANKRHGTGVAFRPHDGTIQVGRWEEDLPVGMGSRFDSNGILLFSGRWENGKRQGAGVTYHAQDGRIFVGQWKDDVLTGKGTEFDGEGNLLYTGGWKDCKRNGFGTEYRESGEALYSGMWKDNRYEGEGTLHLDNGHMIQGQFQNGQVHGWAAEYDAHGFKCYEGDWENGQYHGQGCKFFPSGGKYQGLFQKGLPQGYLKGFDAQGQLVYEGEWKDDQFCGEGSYYYQGEKVYEGSFRDNCYNGHGYQYQNGNYVFSGNFKNNERDGYGCSYQDGKLQYAGLWKADLYDGAGVLYEDGQAKYAGEFQKGKLHGRANTIRDGKVYEEGVYENGMLIYVKRYDLENETLQFEGNILDGKPNGMGCFFTPFGEKKEEGIFVDGVLRKSMKVSLRTLSPLPEQETLLNTEYGKFCTAPVYVVEQSQNGGVYSGQLKDGVPHGKGTLLYQDHRYTGCFCQGKPQGKGILYRDDGTTLVGEFVLEPVPGTQHIQFENGVSYDYLPIVEESK